MDITEHGGLCLNNRMCRPIPIKAIARGYYRDVFSDYSELRQQYPFTKLFVPPTTYPREVKIIVIAVERSLIDAVHARPVDFTGEYSKLIEVGVPYNYKSAGCFVFGGDWIDLRNLKPENMHFMGQLDDGRFELCVGVPESSRDMKNPILENVRTADNYLIAYEKYQRGLSKTLELISYSHGEAGVKEYGKDKKRYRTK